MTIDLANNETEVVLWEHYKKLFMLPFNDMIKTNKKINKKNVERRP